MATIFKFLEKYVYANTFCRKGYKKRPLTKLKNPKILNSGLVFSF